MGFLAPYFISGSYLLGQAATPAGTNQTIQQAAVISAITPQMQAAEALRRLKMTRRELAWERTLEMNLGDYYLPAYYKDKDAGRENAWDYVEDNPALPRLLIIGDSISRGYTIPVRHALAGRANVHRAPANCDSTVFGLKNLGIWLADSKWDVILWNFGIHDRNTEPSVYRENLESILKRLQTTGAKIIWVRTTPAPLSGIDQEGFTDAEANELNRIADEVMKTANISEVDLYALLRPNLNELQLPNSVHFTDTGYEIMGFEVAKDVLLTLQKR
jgi:lysophospholipase L1-like esterase